MPCRLQHSSQRLSRTTPSTIARRKLGQCSWPASKAGSTSRSWTFAGTIEGPMRPSASTIGTRLHPTDLSAASQPRGPRTPIHLTLRVSTIASRGRRRARARIRISNPPFSIQRSVSGAPRDASDHTPSTSALASAQPGGSQVDPTRQGGQTPEALEQALSARDRNRERPWTRPSRTSIPCASSRARERGTRDDAEDARTVKPFGRAQYGTRSALSSYFFQTSTASARMIWRVGIERSCTGFFTSP